MKNISTGSGLCVLGLCALAYPIVDRLAPTATAAPVAAMKTAMGPVEPTIVWYGVTGGPYEYQTVYRAWTDGRVELQRVKAALSSSSYCSPTDQPCASPRFVISDPNQGYSSAADFNFDQQVDGADLGSLLAMWGPAPRHDIPPSGCPLDLINP